jgi:hypothetical protein
MAVGLFAIYWGVAGLAHLAKGVAEAASNYWRFREASSVGDSLALFGMSALSAILFAVVPAAIAFGMRDRIAGRLAPINSPAAPLAISATDLLRIGALLLALLFGVSGAIELTSGVIASFLLMRFESDSVAPLADIMLAGTAGYLTSGSFKLIAAGLLWHYARALDPARR